MTVAGGASPNGGLDSVRSLERALEARDDAQAAADAVLSAARTEAEGVLARARAAGTDDGRRRHAALLADADREAEAIRAAGELEAQQLLERIAGLRHELLDEFVALLAPRTE